MNIRKLIILSTAIILIIFLFSCTGNTSADSILENPLSNYSGDMSYIVKDGTSDYVIVRPDIGSDDETAAAIRLTSYLNDEFGIKLKLITDWVTRGTEAPNDTYEILVGNTNRAESKEAMKKLRYNDFIVSFSERRIVILGGNNNSTTDAVEYFIDKFLNHGIKQGPESLKVPKSLELIKKDSYVVDLLTINDTPISDYIIVYETGNGAAAAKYLQSSIADMSGFLLDIKSTALQKEPLPHEIYIGKSLRDGDAVPEGVLKPDNPLNYAIYTVGDRIYLSGKSALGLNNSVLHLTDIFFGKANDSSENNHNKLNLEDILYSGEPEKGAFMEIQQSPFGIKLENKHAVMNISSDGKIANLYDKSTGVDIIKSDTASYFCYLRDNASGGAINPKNITIDDSGIFTTIMEDDYSIRFQVTVFDDFISFELLDDIDSNYHSCTFANMFLDYDLSESDVFASTGYAMSVQTHHVFYPSAESKAVRAECFSEIGTKGAKIAVISAPHSQHRDILKSVNKQIEPGALPISDTGGANALDHAENYGDYVIINDSDPTKVNEWIEFYTKYSVDQLDFHQGVNTFRQGDFVFHKTGSAAGFKEKVSNPLREAGIISGLHTYSHYIDYNAASILSDPKWQKDLEVLEVFTLKNDIGINDTTIATVENTEDVSNYFGGHNSPFILIGEELIQITADKNGFINCKRGQSGTKPAEHKAGAEIKRIGGYYRMLAPVPGSELFYHIARETAKAYNEGGFGMIYLDAFDGLLVHSSFAGESAYNWYYLASFVNEILKYAQTDPILEYSTIVPSIWIARGRGGAWDTPARSYKEFNRLHVQSNITLLNRYYTTTLGWYNFYPVYNNQPGNYSTKYTFFDDVDYIGKNAIAYNMSIVYNGLTISGLNASPALKKNMDQYQLYSQLRKSGYFSEEIRKQLRDGEYEYKLVETEDGKYSFYEKHYIKKKLYAADEEDRNVISGTNPFEQQQPFIRIESLLSSAGGNPITLMNFDDTKQLKEQKLSVEYESELNIENNLALKVKVLGNNSDNAICIRLKGTKLLDFNGVSDYIIKLDFDGWREFVLADVDNGEFNDIITKYSGGTSGQTVNADYAVYRAPLHYNRIVGTELILYGDCEGVMIGDIEAVVHTTNAITNPSVTIDNQTLTFVCTLDSTDYLEYTPGQGAIIYDRIGNTRSNIEVIGEFEITAGEFNAKFSGEGADNSPLRATVTFGFTGNRLIE